MAPRRDSGRISSAGSCDGANKPAAGRPVVHFPAAPVHSPAAAEQEFEPLNGIAQLMTGVTHAVSKALAVSVTLGSIAWAADLYRFVGLVIYNEQFLAAMLALALPLVFVVVPGRRNAERISVPWYDAIAAVTGFAAAGYIAIRYPTLTDEIAYLPTDALIVGSIVIVLVAEGLRRTVGLVLFIVVVAFFIFALFGHLVPGELQGRPISLRRLIVYLTIDPNALLGTPMVVATTIVVAFVLFGNLLAASGGTGFFTDLSVILMGRYRGGSAKIAVTASALFGSISGSAVSNVVSTGVMTIPLMRSNGYPRHSAAAIESVASTGGQMLPPIMGAAAFLMAEFLQTSYSEVIVAALVPALLYYAALLIQADLQAARDGIVRVPPEKIPAAGPVVRAGWVFPIPFGVLIGSLFFLNLSPESSALYACIALVLVGVAFGYKGKKLKPGDGIVVVANTGRAVLDIFMIGAAAGLIIGILNLSGLSFALTFVLVKLGAGNLFLLLVIAAGVCILLGMGMPTVGVYVLLAALVAPALAEVGVRPMAAHLFVLYFGMMSMITPPVAIAAFTAASLAGADPMRTGFAAMRFGWPAYVVPFLFVLGPGLMLDGSLDRVALAVATALGGVWLVSVGAIGFFGRRLDPPTRLLFCVAGLALMVPAGTASWTPWSDAAGLVLGLGLIAQEIWRKRRRSATATPPSADG